MGKIRHLFDRYFLKLGVSFLILFIALYPKLPSIQVTHTWVYVRLEDFFIAILVIAWLVQLVRKKVHIPIALGSPIALYWLCGFLSFVFSLIFIGPHIANFFPKVAALSYIRRIEYMILFFIAFSSIKSKRDVRDYFVILCVTIFSFVVYGFGQKYYLLAWQLFPKFFEAHPFCFPSIQTGNEEFAKGVQLCLPADARITATFAGHYDLGAYLVIVIPILVGVMLSVKKWFARILLFILSILSIVMIIFTSSRVSFIAYILGVCMMLIFYQKKKFILPFLVVSMGLLLLFSASTAKRFMDTIRLTSIVTNNQGQVVGEAESSLPDSLRNKIAKNSVIEGNVPTQKLPEGSGFIGLPQTKTPVATSVAVVKSSISVEEARRLKLANGGIEISTVSGTFLVQKAFVYDISFTTRFQSEWPNAWNAFLRAPPVGSGYATITLASDNDYLRFLGESGFLGLLSFASIFLVLGILLSESLKSVDSPITKGFVLGLAGGILGLLFNATLIDVFESSKVAETLWMLVGIGAGSLLLYKKEAINYKEKIKHVLLSPYFLVVYLAVIIATVFLPSINNFFVADDFTWLKWAAQSTLSSTAHYFTNADGFFYRPLAKEIVFFLYTFFSFQPQGYHVFMILLHVIATTAVFVFVGKIVGKKYLAFTASLLFALLPAFSENLFWFSTISTSLATIFILFGLINFIAFRRKSALINYVLSLGFFVLALLSYEIAIVFPLLVLTVDIFSKHHKKDGKFIFPYIPFVALIPIYFIVKVVSHAFVTGGGYMVSISHLIPNVVGNFVGYFGLFIFGQSFVPVFETLRDTLKSQSIIVTGVLVVLIAGIVGISWMKRKSAEKLFTNTHTRIVAFAILFSFIALLPVLGLGNIAPRYGYLAGVGFVILAALFIDEISKLARDKKIRIVVFAILVVIISLIYYIQIRDEETVWHNAGAITMNALTEFRIDYETIAPNSYIYIVGAPGRVGDAWVFPLGMSDSLWFIYRDPTIHIVPATTVAQAQDMKTKLLQQLTVSAYIFTFDKNNAIQPVQ